MTRKEYIDAILELYRTANKSDSEDAPQWLKNHKDASHSHCRAFETVLRDLAMDEQEYDAFIASV